ncbi:hypothetical protein [Solirhodobacter olei]|uniref:hypothetical protein n=1 Tax=Solirhodobacter olei TaxID=2493082 RepID=UPI000FDAFC48|nr:hypothetical protein [Solirhodobacter olei]
MRILYIAAIALLLSSGPGLAQTGLGPVYQALRDQGFSQMQTYQEQGRIRVTARRGGALRQLVYDAGTGRLLWDSMDPRDRAHDYLFMRSQDQLHMEHHESEGDRDHDGGMGGGDGGMGGGGMHGH